MKLSWFNTCEVHKQYQAYMYDMNNTKQCKVQYKRESVEIVDQSQTPRYVSRFGPLLYVPAFTQKDFHYASTQGISRFGKYKIGAHNSSLQQTTST